MRTPADAVAAAEPVAAARRRLVAALRAAGAGRVSDHFVVPAADGRPWGGAHTGTLVPVRWRDHAGEAWLRVADVPFDLLPLRPDAPERRGALFSVGPGVDRAGNVHPAVVLLQIEGPPDEVEAARARLEPVLATYLRDRRTASVQLRDGTWLRTCFAGLGPGPAARPQPRVALGGAPCN